MDRLFNLLLHNRGLSSISASSDTAAGATIEITGVIVSTDIEAEWLGGASAQAVTRALDAMSGPLTMRINSVGGAVMGGRAIAQRMREYKGEITVVVDGFAASIASIVALAGDKVQMAPGSLMMIHRAWSLSLGNAEDMLSTAALLEKIDGQLADTYAAKGKKDAAAYAEMMRAETWFTPDEAVAEGLADEVLPEMKSGAKVQAKAFDLTAYDRAPALAEPQPPPITAHNDNTERDRRIRLTALRIRS